MGALSGIKVIELAGMGPTPFCGMLLADMGADVLRIDRPRPPDNGIAMAAAEDLRGRNKRSARIDLKSPQGVDVLLQLVEQADVIIEGFRPGVTERMGIGPDVCLARNPKLIYARATGWGQDGPMAMTAGHDINYLALTGALSMIGTPETGPLPPLNLVGDLGGGALYLAFGIVSAVLSARTTGQGQIVDAAMIDGVSSLLTTSHGRRQFGNHRGMGQNILDGGAPYYTTYATSDGKYMAVGAIEDRFYRLLLQRLELSADQVPDRADRSKWPELRTIFAAKFATKTRDDWVGVFCETDACVSPVLELDEAPHHPHNIARGQFVTVNGTDHPTPAPRLSQTPGTVRRPPVQPGEHTQEALAEWGLAPQDIDAGIKAGILFGKDS